MATIGIAYTATGVGAIASAPATLCGLICLGIGTAIVMMAEHRKNKRKSNWDKHTKRRSGQKRKSGGRKSQNPDYIKPKYRPKNKCMGNIGGIMLETMDSINMSQFYGLILDSNRKRILCVGDKQNMHNYHNLTWYHFCTFLKMFQDDGLRSNIAFSLDVKDKINNNDIKQRYKLKKVYYPESYLKYSQAGNVMFEADWFIKTLQYNLDTSVTSNIPNYKSYMTMWREQYQTSAQQQRQWHRLWIVVDSLQHSNNSECSKWINKVKFKILVKKMYVDQNGNLKDDENTAVSSVLQHFVDNMNKAMDIIQQNNDELQKLEDVYRALKMAEFVYQHNVSINPEFITQVIQLQEGQFQNTPQEIDAYYKDGFQGGINLHFSQDVKSNYYLSNKITQYIQTKCELIHLDKGESMDIDVNGHKYTIFILPSCYLGKNIHYNPIKPFIRFIICYLITMIIFGIWYSPIFEYFFCLFMLTMATVFGIVKSRE